MVPKHIQNPIEKIFSQKVEKAFYLMYISGHISCKVVSIILGEPSEIPTPFFQLTQTRHSLSLSL
jgi:hypothetical protein